ncbi:hypothetical protein LA76x_3774 [Lysobacter antibioticus]|uniref:Uncharacterized protein n=1 Tax=Lysobacter antibioticus TaxID=84531 RepID=A0A0S2FED1_LYSAN|nr:hypothetical protein LA76x_3774 [Lysobacter antibioticus]
MRCAAKARCADNVAASTDHTQGLVLDPSLSRLASLLPLAARLLGRSGASRDRDNDGLGKHDASIRLPPRPITQGLVLDPSLSRLASLLPLAARLLGRSGASRDRDNDGLGKHDAPITLPPRPITQGLVLDPSLSRLASLLPLAARLLGRSGASRDRDNDGLGKHDAPIRLPPRPITQGSVLDPSPVATRVAPTPLLRGSWAGAARAATAITMGWGSTMRR